MWAILSTAITMANASRILIIMAQICASLSIHAMNHCVNQFHLIISEISVQNLLGCHSHSYFGLFTSLHFILDSAIANLRRSFHWFWHSHEIFFFLEM